MTKAIQRGTTPAERFNRAVAGGPGLRAYSHRGDVYCPDCAEYIISRLIAVEAIDEEIPQPTFFPEHEEKQYCVACAKFLYGGNLD